MAAARSVSEAEVPAPDTGAVADDLRAIARGLVHVLTRTPAGAAVVQMIAEVPRNVELAAEHRAFVEARRGMTIRAVRRGIARGELRADTDPSLVADALAGPIFYRLLLTGGRLDGAYADRVADQAIRAFTK
jgi:AcrR family transcriptional regulator